MIWHCSLQLFKFEFLLPISIFLDVKKKDCIFLFESQMKGHQVLRKKNKEKWNVLICLPNILSLGLLKEWELLFILIKSIISFQRSFPQMMVGLTGLILWNFKLLFKIVLTHSFVKYSLSSLSSYWFTFFIETVQTHIKRMNLTLWFFVIWP